MNQVVSPRKGQQAQYDFVLNEASRRADDAVSKRLGELGAPPFETADQLLGMQKLVARYGGVFHKEPNRLWMTIQGVFRGLVTPWEIPRLIRANNVSLEAMNDELLQLDLARSVPSIDVPVLFFLGRYDRQTNPELATKYFAALEAPVKRLIWFQNSAHNIPFEEPDLFNATVFRQLGSLAVVGGIGPSERRAFPNGENHRDKS